MQLKNKLVTILIILVCFLGLIAIRIFENTLFYDPLIKYYKGNFQHQDLPIFDTYKLFLNLSARFILNSLFSVLIIKMVFDDINFFKISIVLYSVAMPLFLLLVYIALSNYKSDNYTLLFYSRRFLIQPILLLIFLPAFYYQKKIRQSHER